MILKPQEFGDGNVPEKIGKGEGKGTSRPQLQSVKFNLSFPHGSKNPGKCLVLEIPHGCYLISSASAQNSGHAISNLE